MSNFYLVVSVSLVGKFQGVKDSYPCEETFPKWLYMAPIQPFNSP